MKKSTLLISRYFTFTLLVFFCINLFAYASANAKEDVVQVANLGALLQESFEENTTVYEITGEVILTYQQDFRNQKYIQDETGAIMIDDAPSGNFNPGIITSEYQVYDGITGLKGTISIFGNMRQFVPTEDPGEATSQNNEVVPVEVSLTDFVNNFMDYQSLLITLLDVSFVDPEGNFANGQVYTINDGEINAGFRTTFFGEDYIGTPIPQGEFNITGLPNSRSEGNFFTARNLADFTALSVFEVEFSVIDEEDTPITDAVITLAGVTNAAGDYTFTELPGGVHPFSVEKAGYLTRNGFVTGSEGIVEQTVVLVLDDPEAVVSFPFTEDMESGVFPPEHWSHYAYGDGSWDATDDTPYGDAAAFHSLTATPADSWLVSPQIQLPEEESMLLKFFQKNSFMQNYDEESLSAVKISTGSKNPEHGDFELVHESSTGIENYTERIIGLGDYAGHTVYIAFVYQGATSHNWYIDDISIEESSAISVANIAELYALIQFDDEGDPFVDEDITYEIAGEVFITHQQQAYRGQIYIQDDSGAIMIDDPEGIIVSEYNNYDGITGLRGTISVFQNMLQVVPTEDPGDASSTGNTIEPMVITLSQLSEDMRGMLVKVRNVSFDFDNMTHTDFTHNQSFPILDATGSAIIRTPNSVNLLDYFSTPIPTTPKDIIGVLHQRHEVTRLQPRSLADFMEPTTSVTEEVMLQGLRVFPNPVRDQLTIMSDNNIEQIRVFNLNGQLVKSMVVNTKELTINVSDLNAGLYIIQAIAGDNAVNYRVQIQR